MRNHSIIKQVLLASFLTAALSLCGKAQQAPAAKPAAPAPEKPVATAPQESPEKVVLKVGTQSFTKADMEFLISTLSPQLQQVVAQRGKKPLGDQYAMMAALSQQGEKDHLDASATFRQQMALHRLQALAQAEYEKVAEDIKVSPEEINQYYTAHAKDFDQAEVREFVIRKRAEGAKEDAPGLPAAEAHARAEEIRKALTAGTDPKKVAEQFAAENTIMVDAEPRAVKHGQLIAALDKAAFELKDGAVSDPFENDKAVAFLQVVGHKHQELKEVSSDIENTLHEQKVQETVEGLKSKANVWMDSDYFAGPSEPAEPQSSGPQQ
jgi:parvulin-like peptidyl-prolyl isomerase